MAGSQQRISKGFYQYSQVNNYITVKNYMFLREKGKKCLLIRFVNDADFTVDSMEYVVVQFGSGGQTIDTTRVVCEKMNLAPGAMYASNDSIVVDDYCTDFKIVFSFARSGNYVYTVRDGRVVADYVLPQEKLEISGKKRERKIKHFSVERKLITRPTIAMLSPVAIAVISLLGVALHMLFSFLGAAQL